MSIVYKIVARGEWAAGEKAGWFEGTAVDTADGFIHFSTAAQIEETARRHFAGEIDLLLVAVDADALGGVLRWELSRGGDLFPHLYGPLPLSAVRAVRPLPDSPSERDFSRLLA